MFAAEAVIQRPYPGRRGKDMDESGAIEKTVNGKAYPLWDQFIRGKSKWIGGIIEDFGDSMDRALFGAEETNNTTKITDITLEPNGKDSAFFEIKGESFCCGFDVHYGGISGNQESGWLTFSGYGGHTFRIKGVGE